MAITITAFERSPDRGAGLARDMRVRWALEEVGRSYDVNALSFAEMKTPEHRERHPFEQIPTYDDGDVALFESGAIVLHIAQRFPGLLPAAENGKARAITWVFAALNTVEPPILELTNARLLEADTPWSKNRLPLVEDRVRARLRQLSVHLADSEWLEDEFTAGDLMMGSVLLRLKRSGLLAGFSNLESFVARCEVRPAYARAFEDQLALFQKSQAP